MNFDFLTRDILTYTRSTRLQVLLGGLLCALIIAAVSPLGIAVREHLAELGEQDTLLARLGLDRMHGIWNDVVRTSEGVQTAAVVSANTLFSDSFETGLSWTKSGDVTWYAGSPHAGTHGVRLRQTGGITKNISLVGYSNIVVSFSMGAYSLDTSKEKVQALYYDGTNWVEMAVIQNNGVHENNALNAYSVKLPASVQGLAKFAIRFKLTGNARGDYAYIDDVVVTGDTAPATVSQPVAYIAAIPQTVSAGEATRISWSSTNASACTGSGFETGTAASGTQSVTPTQTTTYSVTCTNGYLSALQSVTVSVATATLSSTDPRVAYWVSPQLKFADLRRWDPVTQISGQNQHLADVTEPGIIGVGSDYTFSRVADPQNANKHAFRHRLSGSFPTWGSADSRRSEISANWSNDGTNVLRGTDYWVAFAIKFEPDMFVPGNGEVSLLDFHQVPDDGEAWLPSSFSMYAGENNIRFSKSWDVGQPTISSHPPFKNLWNETAPTTSEWQYFVVKMKMHWDVTQNPYIKIWRAVGNGPLVQIADDTGPNDYNNLTPYIPQKFGMYRWDAWAGQPTRTIFTKGFYMAKDQPGTPALSPESLYALLKQI